MPKPKSAYGVLIHDVRPVKIVDKYRIRVTYGDAASTALCARNCASSKDAYALWDGETKVDIICNGHGSIIHVKKHGDMS